MANSSVNPQMPPPPFQQAPSEHTQPADVTQNSQNRISAIVSSPAAVSDDTPIQERRAHSRDEIPLPPPNPNAMVAPIRSNDEDEGLLDRLVKRIGSRSSVKSLLLTTLMFFVLIVILTATKFLIDQSRYKQYSINTFSNNLSDTAQNAARALNNQIDWIDNALLIQGSPQQTVDFIARNKNVVGVAIIDASGQILAATDGAGPTLSKLNRDQVPQTGVQINSLISKNGTPTPLITKRSGNVFISVALQNKSLLASDKLDSAIVFSNGKVIDGNADLGLAGTQKFYDISLNTLRDLTTSNNEPKVFAHKLSNDKVWLGAAAISKDSYLTVITTNKRSLPPNFTQNIILFCILFLGMAWLIWSLMSQLLKQLDAVRSQKSEDEISRQRYRAAVDGSRGGVWEIDFENNSAFLSQSLAKLLGMPEKDITITFPQFLDLFAHNDREKLYNTIRRSHVSGEFDIELGVAQIPLFIACRGRPSVRGSDQAKVVIGVALDITEMRGTQARLQAAEVRLYDALRSMNDSFVIWDQMGRLVLWNNKFEDFFGFQPGNLQAGMEYALVEYHADKTIENVFSISDTTGKEIELKDGRWLRYLETETFDGSRVSIGTEVTTIRAREKQLQTNQNALERTINILRKSQVRIVELAENYEQEKIRAEDANQSKSEFLANMSHELRTPLNAINGFSDIMKKELFGPLGDPRYKEYVSDILFSGQHLLSLINDILDMSKIEAGKMKLNTEALNINDTIRQVLR
ncbi:MAG: histidine kinase dimerization/phospho-acceptor domain-containing protein, partial [Litorimonas sp.]